MDISGLRDFDYFEMLKFTDKLYEEYPFIGVSSIGKSVMGRKIMSLTVGSAEEYVLFLGGLHGRDQFTCALLMAFFDELCRAIRDNGGIEGLSVRKALTGRALVVVPCVNPDGCEIASKGKAGCGNRLEEISRYANGSYKNYVLNARGVDVDLNFSARSALSEPESAALASLCREKPIRQVVVLGSGNREIITPGGEKIPARSNRMAEIMTASTGYGISFNRNDHRREGFIRWFCGEYFKPAFKVLSSVREGGMTESEYIKLYKELRELLMLTAIM